MTDVVLWLCSAAAVVLVAVATSSAMRGGGDR